MASEKGESRARTAATWVLAVCAILSLALSSVLGLDQLAIITVGPELKPTIVVQSPQWSAQEEFLLARINPNLREDCTKSDSGPAYALARLNCEPDSIVAEAYYFLFDRETDLDRYWGRTMRREDVLERAVPCTPNGTARYRYDIDLDTGETVEDAGRIACFERKDDGPFIIMWTLDDSGAFGWIWRHTDRGALFEWWQHGGALFPPAEWN